MSYSFVIPSEWQARVVSRHLDLEISGLERGPTAGYIHHLIPADVWHSHAVIRELGWNNNHSGYESAINVMELPQSRIEAALAGLAFGRPHNAAYSSMVHDRLNKAWRFYREQNWDAYQRANGEDVDFLAGRVLDIQQKLRSGLDRSFSTWIPQVALCDEDPLMPLVRASRINAGKTPFAGSEPDFWEMIGLHSDPNSYIGPAYLQHQMFCRREASSGLSRALQQRAWANVPLSPTDILYAEKQKSVTRKFEQLVQRVVDYVSYHPLQMTALSIVEECKRGRNPVCFGVEASAALPSLIKCHGLFDEAGPRDKVTKLIFKFTGADYGDAHNNPVALFYRDTSGPGQLDHCAAHLLLLEDGRFVRDEQFLRPWTFNPRLMAGHNSNAIGVYVEGIQQLQPAQKRGIRELGDHMQSLWKSMGDSRPTSILPACHVERSIWTES